MVYKYRTVKCPHCGKTSDSSVRKDYQELTGSPFRVCPNCKKTYFDSGYQEPALLKYNDTGIEINFWSVIGAGIFTALAVYMITEIVKGSDSGTIMYVVAGIFAFLALVLISGIVRTIIHLFRKEEYHLAQVEYLEGRKGALLSEDKESMERLSDKGYLDALKINGVEVPDYFYTRLGIGPTDNSPYRQPQQVKRFICRGCGSYSTGWYQTCPKCGISGKMEEVLITLPPESSQAPELTLSNKQQDPVKEPSTPTRQSSHFTSQEDTVEPIVHNTSASSQIDPTLSNQLRQLKQLLDEGLITEDEFTAKKKQMLGLK